MFSGSPTYFSVACGFIGMGWAVSVGLVFYHAMSSKRNVIFWTLVAVVLPFLGALLYLLYCVFLDSVRLRGYKARRLDVAGERILKYKGTGEKDDSDGLHRLMRYRDKQIEEILVKGNPLDAIGLIERRKKEASAKGDLKAVETLEFYETCVEHYQFTSSIPDVLLDLWR